MDDYLHQRQQVRDRVIGHHGASHATNQAILLSRPASWEPLINQ
ncbi:hypothetical protein [Rhodovastum atsumiense]|nr:hypothetical protein [Rhodovastum atsumiense]